MRLSFVCKTQQRTKGNRLLSFYECSCGEFVLVQERKVNLGTTQSCGCFKREQLSKRSKGNLWGRLSVRHGHTVTKERTPEYRAYSSAKSRCTNPNVENWQYYGGRGVQFKFASFEEFYAELGNRPDEGMSLDRKDPDGHYEKGNVRWATALTQRHNQRRSKYQN